MDNEPSPHPVDDMAFGKYDSHSQLAYRKRFGNDMNLQTILLAQFEHPHQSIA